MKRPEGGSALFHKSFDSYRMVVCWIAAAATLGAAFPASAEGDLLPPDRAFRFSVRALSPQLLETHFRIADGYYLYREKLRFSVDPARDGFAAPSLPSGKVKEDAFFGRVETYRGDLVVTLSLKDARPGERIVVEAESQGCADAGVCYPPSVQQIPLVMPIAPTPAAAEVQVKKGWFD